MLEAGPEPAVRPPGRPAALCSSLHYSRAFHMPNLSTYTGNPLTELAMSFIRKLEAKGFSVATTSQGPQDDERKTLRITWRGVYIGQMSEVLWGRRTPYVCLYRFAKEGARPSVAKASADFEVGRFARQHGCSPDRLHVHTDYSGSYLWVEDEATGLHLMRQWAQHIDGVLFPSRGTSDAEQLQKDLQDILTEPTKTETERWVEVAARLGQGTFRADLEQEFGNACAATGLGVLPALRASHIVPWRSANDVQRLDPMNGLLLSANLDALFDRHMITFLPEGDLRISASIAPRELEKLGPVRGLRDRPCPERAAYLSSHNNEFARLENERQVYVKASMR